MDGVQQQALLQLRQEQWLSLWIQLRSRVVTVAVQQRKNSASTCCGRCSHYSYYQYGLSWLWLRLL